MNPEISRTVFFFVVYFTTLSQVQTVQPQWQDR